MYDTSTKGKFLELRAKGWSLARIAQHLNVSQRTLADWNKSEKENLRLFRAMELEALQEKVLASHEHELKTFKANLDRIEEQLARKSYQFEKLSDLYKMAALVRQEIRKLCAYAQKASDPPADPD